MGINVVWCDEFVRLDPRTGAVLDGDRQRPSRPPVCLTSARNQCASFQLLVGPLRKAQEATVSARTLRGPGRARMAHRLFDVFVEWYLRVDGTWYPEILVPQRLCGGATAALRERNGVRAARFAGFWIDLFVPSDARPGRYTGELLVRSGAEQLEIPVELEVLKGCIPSQCCMDVSMNNYADTISGGWPGLAADPDHLTTARYRRIEQGVFRAAHEHRTFLHYLPYGHSGYVHPTFAPPLAGEGPRKRVASWSAWDRHFGPYFDGSAFRGTRRGAIPVPRFYLPLNLCWPADFVKFGQPGYAAEWRAVGRQMVEHFRQKGWTRTRFDLFLNHKQRYRYFPWDTEEARFLGDLDLHRYFRTLWEGTFDRKSTRPVTFDYTLGTTWTYHLDIKSDLAELVDLFIAGTDGPATHPADTPRLQKAGRQVWSCTHSGSIVDSTRAAAFTPLLMWMRNLDGFMPRWCSLGWGREPWREVPDKGGTTFFYPGAELGSEATFPSLRLKVLRNALQTIDALEAASDRARGEKGAVRRRINRLLGIPNRAWFVPRPAYLKKPPKDWTNADFATEEPPAVAWRSFSADQFRALRRLAASLA